MHLNITIKLLLSLVSIRLSPLVVWNLLLSNSWNSLRFPTLLFIIIFRGTFCFFCASIGWCLERCTSCKSCVDLWRACNVTTWEDWSVWFFSFVLVDTETLWFRHVEILDFQMLNSIAENAIHFPQMYQLIVNTVDSYWLFLRLKVVLDVLLLLRKSAILGITLWNIVLGLVANHWLKLVTVIP